YVHVVVVGLVLGPGNQRRVDLGDQRRLGLVVVLPQVVLRRAVMLGGRATGDQIGIALQDVVCILAFKPVQHRGISIQMIEVLQQTEAIGLGLVGIRLILGDCRGHLDGNLLVGNGSFQRGMVGRQQPVHSSALMLFHPADLRQGQLQSLVEPRQVMLVSQCVGFDAVHQDHAHSGEGIIIKLADGQAGHLFPGQLLLCQRGTLVILYSGQTVHIASWGNWEWLLWDQAESCFVVVLLGGSTGESYPVDGNSTATFALSTPLAAASATLGTLGIAATLLAASSSGFGGALGIVSEIALATTMLLCHFNSPGWL